MSVEEMLILVDENDKPLGKLEKSKVHRLGLLHRAFSVFIFNSNGELLLQQRAFDKYHSGGLWTNTCCSHPRYGEELTDAVERRLHEEMGIRCKTNFVFSFVYKTKFKNGLTEHEYDHVFFGVSNDIPGPNHKEVNAWKYMPLKLLEEDLFNHPQIYSAWLKISIKKVINHFQQYTSHSGNS